MQQFKPPGSWYCQHFPWPCSLTALAWFLASPSGWPFPKTRVLLQYHQPPQFQGVLVIFEQRGKGWIIFLAGPSGFLDGMSVGGARRIRSWVGEKRHPWSERSQIHPPPSSPRTGVTHCLGVNGTLHSPCCSQYGDFWPQKCSLYLHYIHNHKSEVSLQRNKGKTAMGGHWAFSAVSPQKESLTEHTTCPKGAELKDENRSILLLRYLWTSGSSCTWWQNIPTT